MGNKTINNDMSTTGASDEAVLRYTNSTFLIN